MDATQTHKSRADFLRIFGPAVLLAIAAFIAAYQFVEPAPPNRIVIATGDPNGAYFAFGEQYREILARDNIELVVQATEGSAENIALLESDDSEVQVAFVQGGTRSFAQTDTLLSLATLYLEPLWIFHRSDVALERLTDLVGRRVHIGAENSGTRALALMLFSDNSMQPSDLELSNLASDEAVEELRTGTLDALFMVASAESPQVRQLLAADGIRLMSLERADAYIRLHRFVSMQMLPEGVIDLAADLPPDDIILLAPTANLVAQENLHPALVDLLLQAADEVHGGGSLFSMPGEFPSPQYVDFPLSPDAQRFFDNGPPFLRRVLPFWAATLVDRLKVMLLPLVALAIPLLRFMPPVYRWRMRERIYRWYKELRAVETSARDGASPAQISDCMSELDRIEAEVQDVSIPPSYSEELYHLRMHIGYVRQRLHLLEA